MSATNLKSGSKGDEVKSLQDGLIKLGFDVDADGHFGPKTETAVKTLQGMFGYDTDGIAGDGTQKLVTAQIGHGWNATLPNAKELAMQAQGKGAASAVKGAVDGKMSGGADSKMSGGADSKMSGGGDDKAAAAAKKAASAGSAPAPGGHTSKK
jgi:peptidoglycan hydrolase-like protein with peptidoglycan-binding domain